MTSLQIVEAELAEMRANYAGACRTIADMHAAALGEVCGPIRGVVEDVADVRAELERMRTHQSIGPDLLTAVIEAVCDELGSHDRDVKHAIGQGLRRTLPVEEA
jgi:hypothetical protein